MQDNLLNLLAAFVAFEFVGKNEWVSIPSLNDQYELSKKRILELS